MQIKIISVFAFVFIATMIGIVQTHIARYNKTQLVTEENYQRGKVNVRAIEIIVNDCNCVSSFISTNCIDTCNIEPIFRK